MQRFAPFALGALAAACAARTDQSADNRYAPADASAEQNRCFNARFIDGFSEVDRDTVRVRVNRNDYYDLNVSAGCFNLDWATQLAVTTRSSSNLCVGPSLGDARVVTREESCSIVSIEHSPRRPAAGEITPFGSEG